LLDLQIEGMVQGGEATVFAYAGVILLSLVYCASGSKKLLKPHPAFGPGANYPLWFQSVSGAFEMISVVLMYYDRPLALLASCMFLGGVLFTQLLPNGPLAKSGPKALIPVVICGSATVYLLLNSSKNVPNQTFDGFNGLLGLTPNKFLFVGGTALGFLTGAILKASNAGTSPD
jgi:hypothetical protein